VRELVLVHGWGMARSVWAPLLRWLEGGFRVHNLALPGYPGGPACPRAETEALAPGPLLDHWSDSLLARAPAGAIWVGWSLGALATINALLRAPGAIAAAVLVAATPRFTRGAGWPDGVAPDTLQAFREGMQSNEQTALKRFALLHAGGGDAPRTLARTLMADTAFAHVDRRVLHAGLRVLEGVDLRDSVGAIDARVRLVHGAGDRIVPPGASAWLAARLPAAGRVVLDTGHAPFVSRPRAFAEQALAWR